MSKKKVKKRIVPAFRPSTSTKQRGQKLSRDAVQKALPRVEVQAFPIEMFSHPPPAHQMIPRLAAFLFTDLVGPVSSMEPEITYASIGGLIVPADTLHDLCTLILDLWQEGIYTPQRIPYTQEYCRQEWQLYQSGALTEQADKRVEQEDWNAPITREAVLSELPGAQEHLLRKGSLTSPLKVIFELTQRIHEQVLKRTNTPPALVIGGHPILREERREQILQQVFHLWQEGAYTPGASFPYSLEQLQRAWQRMQEEK